MRSLFVVFSFFGSFLLQAQTTGKLNEVEPSLQMTKAFEKDFPKIKPSWRKEYSGDDKDKLSYDADFTVNNTNMTAVYSAIGIFKVLEVEIKPADIPSKISNYFAKNYPKNKIRKAARLITNSNKITYEIGIIINGKWVDAVFNKECDFLEMVEKND